MATHDYSLANQSGSSFRTDLNNVLAAIVSNNSASSEPSTKYSYQYWADTSSGYLKIRNAANNAWIQLFKLDGTLSDIPVEGTVIKSTGESGGTKFLREDGDNSCSWQSISTTALTGSTNNTICTVTGANAIQGESTFTYDAGALVITGDSSGDGISITNNGDHYTSLNFDADRSAANNAIAIIEGKWNNTVVANIRLETGDDTTNKDDGEIAFSTTTSGGSITERVRIDSNGKVGIGTASPTSNLTVEADNVVVEVKEDTADSKVQIGAGSLTGYINLLDSSNTRMVQIHGAGESYFNGGNLKVGDGDLIIGTSGHGIDFSATSDGSGTDTSETLSDYEEGTWTPTYGQYGGATNGSQTYSAQQGFYIKIGSKVQVWFDFTVDSWSGASGTGPAIYGLPYAKATLGGLSHYYTGLTTWQVSDAISNTLPVFTGWINSGETRIRTFANDTVNSSAYAPLNVTGRIAGSLVYTAS